LHSLCACADWESSDNGCPCDNPGPSSDEHGQLDANGNDGISYADEDGNGYANFNENGALDF
jgi:hypothetical protein